MWSFEIRHSKKVEKNSAGSKIAWLISAPLSLSVYVCQTNHKDIRYSNALKSEWPRSGIRIADRPDQTVHDSIVSKNSSSPNESKMDLNERY